MCGAARQSTPSHEIERRGMKTCILADDVESFGSNSGSRVN